MIARSLQQFATYHGALTTLLFLGLALLSSCSGCDENNSSDKSATVTIVSVEPAAAYPNIETTISFTLAPGTDTSASELKWQVNYGDGQSSAGEGLESSVTHAYADSGDYEITVQARIGESSVGEAKQTFRVYAPVDLAVSAATGRPANIRTGEMITIEASLENKVAGNVETPFEIEAFLSTSPTVTREQLAELTSLGRLKIEASEEGAPVIEASQPKRVTLNATLPDALNSGDYYIVVLADATDIIADTDTSNNLTVSSNIVRVENTSQVLADLVVRDVIAAPDRAFPALSRVTRGYTLANTGGLDVFDVVVKTYISVGDATLDDNDTLINTSEPINVFARTDVNVAAQAFILDQELIPPQGGELEVYVIVEAQPSTMQDETSKENNIAATQSAIVVSDQLVNGPDIAVREFSVTPESTFLDGTLTVQAKIANEGTVDINTFFCGLYLGKENRVNTDLDQRFSTLSIPSLKSGEERIIDEAKEIPAIYDPGTYYIYIVCDPLGAVEETFRSNNQAIHPNPVLITDQADVDLYVESLTVPKTTNEGELITLTARVCVNGTNPSGMTRAKLFRTPGNRVDFNATALQTIDIPNINPGMCEDVTIELVAACDQFKESYAWGLSVDADDVLPETDEDNNNRAGTDLMIVSGLFCACNEDMFEPNNRATDAKPILATMNTSAALCAAGTCDFFKLPLEARDSIIISNLHDSARGALVTTLYDPTGLNAIDVSRTMSQHEVATFLVPSAGDYIVSVCGQQTQTRNIYELSPRIIKQAAGVDIIPRQLTFPARDSYSIGASINTSFKVYNLGLANAAAFEAQLVISSNATLGDADDIVLKTSNIAALNSGAQRDINEAVILPTNLVDGTYYLGINVNPAQTITEDDYTNNMLLGAPITIVTRCFDALEPNDSIQDARDIQGSGTFSNLTACSAADDYYKICAADGQTVTVTLTFNDMMGDLDLELFNQQLQGVASSANAGVNNEQVNVPYVNGAQCYYALVKLKSAMMNVENSYTLDVAVQDVDPSLRCDAWGEPNDTFLTASSLLAASQVMSLDRCPNTDTDYYYVDLQAGQRVTFKAEKVPGTQPGTLRLQLYNANQTPGLNQETAPDQPAAEIRDFIAPVTGRYFAQVTVSGNARNVKYTLSISGLTGVDLSPRNLAIGPGVYLPNDQVRLGFDLSNLGASATMSAPNYTIYYSLSATPDSVNDVSLGNFMAPMPIAASSTLNLFSQVNLPAAATAGTRYIHVVVSSMGDTNPANNVATVPITVGP